MSDDSRPQWRRFVQLANNVPHLCKLPDFDKLFFVVNVVVFNFNEDGARLPSYGETR